MFFAGVFSCQIHHLVAVPEADSNSGQMNVRMQSPVGEGEP